MALNYERSDIRNTQARENRKKSVNHVFPPPRVLLISGARKEWAVHCSWTAGSKADIWPLPGSRRVGLRDISETKESERKC